MDKYFFLTNHAVQYEWLKDMQDSYCIAKSKLKKKLKFLFSNKYFETIEQLEVKEECDVNS